MFPIAGQYGEASGTFEENGTDDGGGDEANGGGNQVAVQYDLLELCLKLL
jgi:hypothetical protein